MLNHGGQLARVRADYPAVTGDWLDLSTGIAPWSWPVAEIPTSVWRDLPDQDALLRQAAADYYGWPADRLLAVAGSQVAITLLPLCLPRGRVALPRWGYGEHARCWIAAGHDIVYYHHEDDIEQLLQSGLHYLLVINPNNPTGVAFSQSCLQRWERHLAKSYGRLIIDEAFADVDPEELATASPLGSRIVYKSVGKFFGMAGLRLGFLLADNVTLSDFRQHQILWEVSGPAQWLGRQLLADSVWQEKQKHRIASRRDTLIELLQTRLAVLNLDWLPGPMFVSVKGEPEVLRQLRHLLAERGIWIRFFEPIDDISYARFGLPDDIQLPRLTEALDSVAETLITGERACG